MIKENSLIIKFKYMEKEMSKIENIKKTLAEMESYLAGPEADDKLNDKISQMAEKARNFIDSAENKANEVVTKISEKKLNHCCDDKHKQERMNKYFITALMAFLAIVTLKKIKKESQK